jgi:hypothetical protein
MEYLKHIMTNSHEKRYSMSDQDDYSINKQHSDVATKLHNIFRKMSINIQRDEGTPEKQIVSGVASNPSAHERALMLSIPHSDGSEIDETFEDTNLPTIEEVATDCKKAVDPPCTKYFENPFDTESSSTDDTFVPAVEEKIHPLSTLKTDNHETNVFTSSPDTIMQPDAPQGNQKKRHPENLQI